MRLIFGRLFQEPSFGGSAGKERLERTKLVRGGELELSIFVSGVLRIYTLLREDGRFPDRSSET